LLHIARHLFVRKPPAAGLLAGAAGEDQGGGAVMEDSWIARTQGLVPLLRRFQL